MRPGSRFGSGCSERQQRPRPAARRVTNRARELHRRVDRGVAEAFARDGREHGTGPAIARPRRIKRQDLSMDRPTQPKVKLAELWERTSARGSLYFSGYLGACLVLLFEVGERDHPTKPGEKATVWNLLLQERESHRRPPQSRSERQPQVPDPGGRVSASAPAKASAAVPVQPGGRGAGWRGPSAYKRPSAPRSAPAPVADDAPFSDDPIHDLGR